MKFCVGLDSFFENKGLDTKDWRKSVDGTRAIVHIEKILSVIPDVESDTNVQIYVDGSTEFNTLLNSAEWITV